MTHKGTTHYLRDFIWMAFADRFGREEKGVLLDTVGFANHICESV
jgi:hypothetical protein